MAQTNVAKPRTSLLGLVGWLILAIFAAAVWDVPILGVAELMSRWLPVTALWIYGILAVCSAFIILGVALNISDRNPENVKERPFDNLGGVMMMLVLFVCASGQFLRHWSMRYGGFVPGGDVGYWPWTSFSVSWIVDNASANFGQVFDWSMTSIHPIAQNARVLVWIYNIMLDFLALTVLFRAIGLLRKYGDHL